MLREWVEIVIEVPCAAGEAVANFLIEQGAPGLQVEDRDGTTRLVAYFPDLPPIQDLYDYCADIGCATAPADLQLQLRTIAEQDWAETWKAHSQPQIVGERLYVCPSWNATPPLRRIAIVIDPGMAFGTGQHPTTRGCLVLLERSVATRKIVRALDLGTGSGVLAIALAKLGIPEVCALDTDPQACIVAAANAASNQVGAQVRVSNDLGTIEGCFDLVVANLFANVLVELAGRLAIALPAGGRLICSGFLCADELRVRSAYEDRGFTVADRYLEDSWVTLALDRTLRP
jgi:ribosomal protein L11 methyltransferase